MGTEKNTDDKIIAAEKNKDEKIMETKKDEGEKKMATEKKSDKKSKVNEIKHDVVVDIIKLQNLTKKVVDTGVNSAEDIHQAVSKLPLKYLQKIEKIRKPVSDMMAVQEKTIGHIYDMFQNVNGKVDSIAKDLLNRAIA